MAKTGQRPGAGTYTCKACGETVVLNNEKEALPLCPNCGGTAFKGEREEG